MTHLTSHPAVGMQVRVEHATPAPVVVYTEGLEGAAILGQVAACPLAQEGASIPGRVAVCIRVQGEVYILALAAGYIPDRGEESIRGRRKRTAIEAPGARA